MASRVELTVENEFAVGYCRLLPVIIFCGSSETIKTNVMKDQLCFRLVEQLKI